MTSAHVVETSVNVISNSPSQDYTHPDDRTSLNYDMWICDQFDILASGKIDFRCNVTEPYLASSEKLLLP